MKSMRISLAIATMLLAAPAFAQDNADQPAPQQQQANQPQKPSEQKEIGDWIVRCYPVKSPTPCVMEQMRFIKKTGQRVLGVTFAYMAQRDMHVAVISVPLGVSLANGLVINTDTWKSPAIKFLRCDQGGCYIETAIPNDVMNSIGKATKAEVDAVFTNGKRYNFIFSLKGFNDGHNTLVELSKAHASGASAPAKH
jgi:invasion protein IalB